MRRIESRIVSNDELRYQWKLTGKRPLGRRRTRWEGNVMKDLREIGCEVKSNYDRIFMSFYMGVGQFSSVLSHRIQ